MFMSSTRFQSNNSNKDGGHQRADLIAMIEAAKSKIHQVWLIDDSTLAARRRLTRRPGDDIWYQFSFFNFLAVQSSGLYPDEILQGM